MLEIIRSVFNQYYLFREIIEDIEALEKLKFIDPFLYSKLNLASIHREEESKNILLDFSFDNETVLCSISGNKRKPTNDKESFNSELKDCHYMMFSNILQLRINYITRKLMTYEHLQSITSVVQMILDRFLQLDTILLKDYVNETETIHNFIPSNYIFNTYNILSQLKSKSIHTISSLKWCEISKNNAFFEFMPNLKHLEVSDLNIIPNSLNTEDNEIENIHNTDHVKIASMFNIGLNNIANILNNRSDCSILLDFGGSKMEDAQPKLLFQMPISNVGVRLRNSNLSNMLQYPNIIEFGMTSCRNYKLEPIISISNRLEKLELVVAPNCAENIKNLLRMTKDLPHLRILFVECKNYMCDEAFIEVINKRITIFKAKSWSIEEHLWRKLSTFTKLKALTFIKASTLPLPSTYFTNFESLEYLNHSCNYYVEFMYPKSLKVLVIDCNGKEKSSIESYLYQTQEINENEHKCDLVKSKFKFSITHKRYFRSVTKVICYNNIFDLEKAEYYGRIMKI
uniref:F-box domain-containing protein n=1 Tax=Rhabditophanes sp. KR3021 TaxID=114890 RepID=A0AC35UAI9_9BILA